MYVSTPFSARKDIQYTFKPIGIERRLMWWFVSVHDQIIYPQDEWWITDRKRNLHVSDWSNCVPRVWNWCSTNWAIQQEYRVTVWKVRIFYVDNLKTYHKDLKMLCTLFHCSEICGLHVKICALSGPCCCVCCHTNIVSKIPQWQAFGKPPKTCICPSDLLVSSHIQHKIISRSGMFTRLDVCSSNFPLHLGSTVTATMWIRHASKSNIQHHAIKYIYIVIFFSITETCWWILCAF